MSKAHRGKGIRDRKAHGRGECPVCKRNNVKVLYEQEAGEQKFNICKTCKAAIKSGKKKLPVVEQPKPAEAEAPAAPVAEGKTAVEVPAAAEATASAATEESNETAAQTDAPAEPAAE